MNKVLDWQDSNIRFRIRQSVVYAEYIRLKTELNGSSPAKALIL